MNEPAHYVFLHGGVQAGWVWTETIAALRMQSGASFGRALALDAPGCGAKRGRAVETLTMQDIAQELVGDIEAAGMANVVLVGHSQGGQVLPFMAKLRPALFRRLVYVTCCIPLAGQTVFEMMGRSVHGANEHEVGWAFDPAKIDISQCTSLMFCNDMDAAQTERFIAQFGQDSWPPKSYTMNDWCYEGIGLVPATYVACLKDNILPMRWQNVFAARFKAERLIQIDAGHQVMNTRPHALAEVLHHEIVN